MGALDTMPRRLSEIDEEIEFYDLKEIPFSLSPDPRYMYLSYQHTKALRRAKRNIDARQGLTVILGDAGVGKSTVARRLFGMYSDSPEVSSSYAIRYVTNPSHWTTTNKMLLTLCAEFAIKARRSESKQWHEFQEYMATLFREGITVVLLIDEAQLIPRKQLMRIREILNFESNSSKFIQIVLFGTLDMAATLAEPDFKPLRSRAAGGLITLDPLDEKELTETLLFRIKVATGSDSHPVFTPGCFTLVANASGGIIRDAVDYCNMALYLGYTARRRPIDEEVMQAAISSVVKLNEPLSEPEGEAATEPDEPEGETEIKLSEPLAETNAQEQTAS
jgi:general secretion pathway protein A